MPLPPDAPLVIVGPGGEFATHHHYHIVRTEATGRDWLGMLSIITFIFAAGFAFGAWLA